MLNLVKGFSFARINVTRMIMVARWRAHSRLIGCTARSRTPEIVQTSPDGVQPSYPDKLHNIVSEISKLNLLEVAQLNQLLKTELKIPDVATAVMPSYSTMPSAAPQAEEDEEKEAKLVKTSYAVKLIKFDASKKVQLIKEMKNLVSGMNLVQAKKFVETLPQIVKADLSKNEADQLAETIQAAGGECKVE